MFNVKSDGDGERQICPPKLMKKGMAYGGQPFTEIVFFSVPDVGNIYMIWSHWYTGYHFCIYPLH